MTFLFRGSRPQLKSDNEVWFCCFRHGVILQEGQGECSPVVELFHNTKSVC